MTTALFTGCYLEGKDPLGSFRYDRMSRFIAWHDAVLPQADIFLSDNASRMDLVTGLKTKHPEITVLRHTENLTHGPEGWDYPYCWRMLYDAKVLIQLGYEKIIFLDSDCFLVSQSMVNYVDRISSGWEAFWIPKYAFPSAEFHVLCKDAFPIYQAFTSVPYRAHLGKIMETGLPFTCSNQGFQVDRYGESRAPWEAAMDCYSQCPTDIELGFRV